MLLLLHVINVIWPGNSCNMVNNKYIHILHTVLNMTSYNLICVFTIRFWLSFVILVAMFTILSDKYGWSNYQHTSIFNIKSAIFVDYSYRYNLYVNRTVKSLEFWNWCYKLLLYLLCGLMYEVKCEKMMFSLNNWEGLLSLKLGFMVHTFKFNCH